MLVETESRALLARTHTDSESKTLVLATRSSQRLTCKNPSRGIGEANPRESQRTSGNLEVE